MTPEPEFPHLIRAAQDAAKARGPARVPEGKAGMSLLMGVAKYDARFDAMVAEFRRGGGHTGS